MKIKFYGGIEKVTGSNFLIEIDSKKIMIDCGLIQGTNTCELENFEPFPFNPKEVDLVIITHPHLDHSGRLPKLIKEGFNGKILGTLPAKEITNEILLDSLKIIKEECGKELFSEADIDKTLELWEPIDYHKIINIDDTISIEFFDGGHILGAAFVKISSKSGATIVFSGDLGNSPNPILKDTEKLPDTDYLILESTYGDRNHENPETRKEILEDIIEQTIKNNGVLIIPVFAIERTQEILFDISDLIKNKKIPMLKIFLDSPLAFRITEIYQKHHEYFNEEAKKQFAHTKILDYPHLNIVKRIPDEIKMFEEKNPKIILAGSGMLTGGRILNLMRRYISNPTTTLLFVGFQVEGSLGRKILDGDKNIIIENNSFEVRAKIEKLLSYSDHKDQKSIMDWIRPQGQNIKKIFLVHGDKEPKISLKTKIMDDLGVDVEIPTKNDTIELL